MDNGASSYRRFLEGDDSGIVDIIQLYKDGLIFYLNGYTQNFPITEELTEDVFFKLVIKKPKYTEKYSFKTWLYTIGRNVAINYMKRNRRLMSKPIDELESLCREENTLEQTFLTEERKVMVHKTLSKLKAEYREVLCLRYFEEMTNEDAAKVMKKSKRQIENLTFRAKQSLRCQLEKEGFIYEEL